MGVRMRAYASTGVRARVRALICFCWLLGTSLTLVEYILNSLLDFYRVSTLVVDPRTCSIVRFRGDILSVTPQVVQV